MAAHQKLNFIKLSRSLTWEIDNFKFLYDNIEPSFLVQSEKNAVHSNDDPKELLFEWHFKLYPKGAHKTYENACSLYFYLDSLKLPFVLVEMFFLIKDENGRKIMSNAKLNRKFFKDEGAGFHELLPKDYMKKYPFNKLLTIEVDATFSFHHKSAPPTTEDSDIEDTYDNLNNLPKNRLSKDISLYLNNDVFSDVKISVDDQIYYAHKFILSARSSVFAAMFSHDFKENNENLVTVQESPTVFYQILEYIYSNEFPIKETVSEELYDAAHKYGLEELQYKCQALMESSITLKNVLKRLECADLHNIVNLKEKVMKFIKKNFKDIIESQEWSALLQDNVKLVNEVLKHVHS